MAPVRMDAPDVPHHRAQGLTARVVLPEKLPRGLLFKVGVGYFDLDGYWCVPKANGLIEVRRGAPRAVNKHMTAIQRHELARVRLNARRSQLR